MKSNIEIVKNSKGRTMYAVAVDLLLFNKKGQVLLNRRCNTGWNDGNWNLVGGHVENLETLEEALCREAKEELGITVLPINVKIVHCIQHKTDRLTMQFYGTCSKYKEVPKPQAETEHGKIVYKMDKMEFFDVSNLPENTIPSAKAAIIAYNNGTAFSNRGFNDENK